METNALPSSRPGLLLPLDRQSSLTRAPSREGRCVQRQFSNFARTTRPKTMATPLRAACAKRLLALLLLLTLPAAVQAQFNYTTTNGTITITKYTGSGGAVTIPDKLNGYPVASIGDNAFFVCTSLTSVTLGTNVTSIGVNAFYDCTGLTSVTIPDSVTTISFGAFCNCYQLTDVTIPNRVTSIGDTAFELCTSLISATISNSVTSIGNSAFYGCTGLTSATLGTNVTSIGDWAFYGCYSLASITIPNSTTNIGQDAFGRCFDLTNATIGSSVTSIGDWAFTSCVSLTEVYFQGNAPSLGASVFCGDNDATGYCLPGTTGWYTPFGCLPIALWFLPNPLILVNNPSFGVRTNQFGFIICWATNLPVVVEACTDLANPAWHPVSTNTLTDGSAYFSDPQWTSYARRFYRVRSP